MLKGTFLARTIPMIRLFEIFFEIKGNSQQTVVVAVAELVAASSPPPYKKLNLSNSSL